MTEVPMNVLKYCAEEVERQEDGPVAVYHMAVAWDFARSLDVRTLVSVQRSTKFDTLEAAVMKIANLVSPESNPFWSNINMRRTTVIVGDDAPVDWHEVPAAFTKLMNNPPPMPFGTDKDSHFYDSWTDEWHPHAYFVDQWLKFLLDIHPWQDGNGRTASILRNMLCGTLMEPKPLPYYYGDR